jgi:hypothetical protein
VPTLPLRRALWAATILAALVACSHGADESAAKSAAIQKALDAHAPTHAVNNGRLCVYVADSDYQAHLHAYAHVRHVHIAPSGIGPTKNWDGRPARCLTYTWDASAGLVVSHRPFTGTLEATVPIGRYVLDKTGEAQGSSAGAEVIPFKAHFALNDVGAGLAADGIVHAPADITDGRAALHKDADGAWVAQL